MEKFAHINGDFNEDVEAGDCGGVNRHQATVAVVYEEVGRERRGGEVVDAAGAVGYVAENETVGGGSERGEDIDDDEGVHKEALWELQSYALGRRGADAPNALVNLEVVVGWEEGDGGVESRIV